MKTLLLSSLFVAITGLLFSQTGQILIVNISTDPNKQNIDFEIKETSTDSVVALITSVDYLHASGMVTIPANVLLEYTVYRTGTSIVEANYNNQVFDPGQFLIVTLYGTGGLGSATGRTSASSASLVRFNFRHAIANLQSVDLLIRQNGDALANDLSYPSQTFGGTDEFTAASYTFDLTPSSDNQNGLAAFLFNASSLGVAGDFVYFFIAGSASDIRMYMVEMNGTVTELTKTNPIISTGVDDLATNSFVVNPVVAKEIIRVQFNRRSEKTELRIVDNTGKTVISRSIEPDDSDLTIDIQDLSSGIYLAILKGDSEHRRKFIIAR